MNGNNLPTEVYCEPDADYIAQNVNTIISIAKLFCRAFNIDSKKFKINVSALKDLIIRVDERKLYFFIYHNGMKPNECKILALFVYWTLKLRPFWLLTDENNSDFAAQINEKFCAYVFMQILYKINPQKCNEVARNGFLKELAYSFRFRDLTKESLYLIFDACVTK